MLFDQHIEEFCFLCGFWSGQHWDSTIITPRTVCFITVFLVLPAKTVGEMGSAAESLVVWKHFTKSESSIESACWLWIILIPYWRFLHHNRRTNPFRNQALLSFYLMQCWWVLIHTFVQHPTSTSLVDRSVPQIMHFTAFTFNFWEVCSMFWIFVCSVNQRVEMQP